MATSKSTTTTTDSAMQLCSSSGSRCSTTCTGLTRPTPLESRHWTCKLIHGGRYGTCLLNSPSPNFLPALFVRGACAPAGWLTIILSWSVRFGWLVSYLGYIFSFTVHGARMQPKSSRIGTRFEHKLSIIAMDSVLVGH